MTFSDFRNKISQWLQKELAELVDHEIEVSCDDGKTWTPIDELRVRVSFQASINEQASVGDGASAPVKS